MIFTKYIPAGKDPVNKLLVPLCILPSAQGILLELYITHCHCPCRRVVRYSGKFLQFLWQGSGHILIFAGLVLPSGSLAIKVFMATAGGVCLRSCNIFPGEKKECNHR